MRFFGLSIGHTASNSLPLGSLALDGAATPEQIALVLPVTGSLSQSATATCRYKRTADSTWTTGHPLFRVRPSFADNSGPTVDDVFAWPIIDLVAGTSYDVEVTVTSGATVVVKTLTTTTRSLPAASGATTVSISAGSTVSQIQTAVANAAAGAVIEIADGTYSLGSNLQLSNANATTNSPIYIRGASRAGTILSYGAGGSVIQILGMSNVIFERMTLQGPGVDSGVDAATGGVSFYDGSPTQVAITFRNMTITGADRGIGAPARVDQILVYDCTLTGNNLWTQDRYAASAGGAPGAGDGTPDVQQDLFWNDDGIGIPGNGNCAFNNTISGFGDTFTVSVGSGHPDTHGIFYYRNDCAMSGDDFFEADFGLRNMALYDNRVRNTGSVVSFDPIFGGPCLVARNIAINVLRVPWKANGQNTGYFLYNNTIARTNGFGAGTVAGWYQPSSSGPSQRSLAYRNNVFIDRGTTGVIFWLDQSNWDPIDWDHNAHYPNATIKWLGTSYGNLAAAQSGLPATTPIFSAITQRMTGDVITVSNPFNETVTLGSADAMTEITTAVTPTILSGSTPKNAGVSIANITDGFSGASPDMGATISGRNIAVYGDRMNLPAHILAATAGIWTKINSNTFTSVKFSGWGSGGYPSTGDANDVFQAWCGGCFDPETGDLFVTGGGHSGYDGNEFYSANARTGLWSRVSTPSPYTEASASTGVYPDGTPAAIHTYGELCFDTVNHHIYMVGMGFSVSSRNHVFNFNARSGAWPLNLGSSQAAWASTGSHTFLGYGCGFAFDPTTGKFHGGVNDGGSEFFGSAVYDPVGGTYTNLGDLSLISANGTAQVMDIAGRNLYVIGGFGSGAGLWKKNVDTGTWTDLSSSSTGTKTAQTLGGQGGCFDTYRNKIWCALGLSAGISLYQYNPSTNAWTVITPSGSGPGIYAAGTYNRVHYDATLDVIVAVSCASGATDGAGEIWIYKPSDWRYL